MKIQLKKFHFLTITFQTNNQQINIAIGLAHRHRVSKYTNIDPYNTISYNNTPEISWHVKKHSLYAWVRGLFHFCDLCWTKSQSLRSIKEY